MFDNFPFSWAVNLFVRLFWVVKFLLANDVVYICSKSEYVIYKLKEMGKVSEKDIMQISNKFDRLDAGNCGKITLADLMSRHWYPSFVLFPHGTARQANTLSLWTWRRRSLILRRLTVDIQVAYTWRMNFAALINWSSCPCILSINLAILILSIDAWQATSMHFLTS